jgi:hypothetical protein
MLCWIKVIKWFYQQKAAGSLEKWQLGKDHQDIIFKDSSMSFWSIAEIPRTERGLNQSLAKFKCIINCAKGNIKESTLVLAYTAITEKLPWENSRAIAEVERGTGSSHIASIAIIYCVSFLCLYQAAQVSILQCQLIVFWLWRNEDVCLLILENKTTHSVPAPELEV